MSSRPGWTLEHFLAWNYNVAVIEGRETNPSLGMAEALGTSTRVRPRLTAEQFAPVVALFEEHREYVENRLEEFDDENQSWRDYAGYSFDSIPEALYDRGVEILKSIAETPATP